MNEKIIKVGVIGAGARACVLKNLLVADKRVKLGRIFDPDVKACQRWINETDSHDALICKDYKEITTAPDIDWVLVISPNNMHKEHIVSAFENGKNVFAEKPLATQIEDCQAIFDAHKKSGKLFATGFVLRYTPLYRKVKALLDAGEIGKLIAVEANEKITPQHGTHIMTNWRRFAELSGSHMLEKCCHDLDLMNWLIGALPSKVASFGGLNFFVPENENLRGKYKAPETTEDYFTVKDRDVQSPFTSDKTIFDNQVAIIEYRNGVRATFMATLSNVIPERRMYFSGSEGTLIADFYSRIIRVRRLGEDAIREIHPGGEGGHGGGDEVIGRELAETMRESRPITSGGNEGLESAVVALSIEKAVRNQSIIDLEPIWKNLNR